MSTFLLFRGHRSVVQQCCVRLHYMPRIHTNTCEQEINMASKMENVPESFVFSFKVTQHVVTCCERLHTSANIAQQEATLLGPTMLRVVVSVCTGLKNPKQFSFRVFYFYKGRNGVGIPEKCFLIASVYSAAKLRHWFD